MLWHTVALAYSKLTHGWTGGQPTLPEVIMSRLLFPRVTKVIMKYEAIVIALLGSLFTLLGVVIGSYLSHKSAQDLFLLKQTSEVRIRSYARLMGLKLQLVQTIQTHLEAKILTEFYEARYLPLTHNPEDLQEAKRQYDRALALIPEISKLLRDLFETLGEVQVAYNVDDQLSTRLEALYRFRGADIQFPDKGVINTEADLNVWKEQTNKQIHEYLRAEFLDRFEALLPLLLRQLKKAE